MYSRVVVCLRNWLYALFSPPYTAIPYLAWLAFVLFHVIPLGDLPFNSHKLFDSDDFLRLTQVFNWLDGQGWYDLRVPRFDPPDNVSIRYSRLVDLPIAFLILVLEPLLGRMQAAYWTATILPLAYFAILLALLIRLARPLVGRQWARLITLPVICFSPLVCQFSPGRVDHHNVQLIFVTLMLILVQNIILRVWSRSSAAFLALVIGLSLWVGGETLPWVTLGLAYLGWHLLYTKHDSDKILTVLGGGIIGTGWIDLFLARSPEEVGVYDTVTYSIVHAFLMTAIGCSFVVSRVVGLKFEDLKTRLGISICVCFVIAVAYFAAFPEMLSGPYGSITADDVEEYLSLVTETQPLALADYRYTLLFMLVPQLTFFISILSFVYSFSRRRKQVWGIYFVLMMSCIALALFYQARVVSFLYLFCAFPLGALLVWAMKWAAKKCQGIDLFVLRAIIIFLLVPVLCIFLPRIPVQNAPPFSVIPDCNVDSIVDVLDYHGDSKRPGNLFTSIFLGTEVMFKTHYNVFAGPYQIPSNKKVREFFYTAPIEESKKIAETYKLDVVVQCRDYLKFNPWENKIPKDRVTIAKMLLEGKFPDWMVPVVSDLQSPFFVYLISTKNIN